MFSFVNPHLIHSGPHKPKEHYPVTGEARDADGRFWHVRQVRAGWHGFDLLFGTPGIVVGGHHWPSPRLIPTQALKNFWEFHKTSGSDMLYDLPASRTTLDRVYRYFKNPQSQNLASWTLEAEATCAKILAESAVVRSCKDCGKPIRRGTDRCMPCNRRVYSDAWWRFRQNEKQIASYRAQERRVRFRAADTSSETAKLTNEQE
jgi:hypothetical protein